MKMIKKGGGINAALLVIDVQQVLDDPEQGPLNNPGAEKNIARLLDRWRSRGSPVFHVRYLSPRQTSPFHKDAPGSKMKEFFKPHPGEPLVIKHFESAFVNTGLEERLRELKVDTLVVAGFYTDQCIAATAKIANNLGFKVFVAADAAATTGCRGYNGKFYDGEDIHQLALGGLQRDGISIIETDTLLEMKAE